MGHAPLDPNCWQRFPTRSLLHTLVESPRDARAVRFFFLSRGVCLLSVRQVAGSLNDGKVGRKGTAKWQHIEIQTQGESNAKVLYYLLPPAMLDPHQHPVRWILQQWCCCSLKR